MSELPVPFSETGDPNPPDPLIGTLLNRKYRILSLAGSGGMGKVYRGEQLPLGRPVALKILNPSYTVTTKDQSFQKRFFLEASILSKLQHPNIVTVFDYGKIEGSSDSFFMAMEFLAGDTLAERLHNVGTMSVTELFPIARQIARGLREAHLDGVVHRDLKPTNIMLLRQADGNELVKIVDFGLVKVLRDDTDQVTKDGTFLGSPRYMSPEQITHGNVDLRTDVYSLGVILYEALAGQVPFESDHAVQTLMAHIHNPVPPIAVCNPSVTVPGSVEAFVRRCLAKHASERPDDMDAFLVELSVCERALGMVASSADRYDIDTGPQSGTRQAVRVSAEMPTMVEARLGSTGSSVAEELHATARPAAKRRRLAAIAVGLVVVLMAGGLALYGALGKDTTQIAESAAATHRAFVLWVDSSPTGAEVVEDGQVLGTTPMQLSVDNEAAIKAPRRLTIRMAGYHSFSLVQGPSDENVRVAAALVPLAAESDAAASAAATASAQPPVKTGTPPPRRPRTTPPPETDIRLHR